MPYIVQWSSTDTNLTKCYEKLHHGWNYHESQLLQLSNKWKDWVLSTLISSLRAGRPLPDLHSGALKLFHLRRMERLNLLLHLLTSEKQERQEKSLFSWHESPGTQRTSKNSEFNWLGKDIVNYLRY